MNDVPEEVGAAEETVAEAEAGALEAHAAERTARALLVPVLLVDGEQLGVGDRQRAPGAPERSGLLGFWLLLLLRTRRGLLLVGTARGGRRRTGTPARAPTRSRFRKSHACLRFELSQIIHYSEMLNFN